MAEIKPEMLEAARLAGVQGLPDPEEPEASDDNDQHLDTTADLDTSTDKGDKPDTSESVNDETDLSQFPEEFFGTNIQEYAEEHGVEAATVFYNALKDANRVSNRRMQELAELRKTAEADAAKVEAARRVTDEPTPEPVDLSDEDLLTQFGIDPAVLQYEELGVPLVALVKSQSALQTQLANLTKEAESQAWETDFFGTLDALQKESGTITDESGAPVAKVDLEEFAIENNIYDPAALYWRLMGPVLASRPVPPKSVTPTPRRDLKRNLSGPKRKGGAAGSVTGQPPKTLQEHFAAAKEAAGITGDPFAE